MWNEVPNRAGVEAPSALKSAESVYYPPVICPSSFFAPKDDITSKVVETSKEIPAKVLPPSGNPSKEAEHIGFIEKEADKTKEAAHYATQPPTGPKDPFMEKEAPQKMELILATLTVPSMEELKGKSTAFSTIALAQPIKTTTKDKLVIKMKSWVFVSLFFIPKFVISSSFLISLPFSKA